MKIKSYENPEVCTETIAITLSKMDLAYAGKEIFREAIRLVAERMATLFIEKHGTEVLKMLDPQAIANLALAQAGAAINETLNKKLLDKILEYHTVHQIRDRKGWWF